MKHLKKSFLVIGIIFFACLVSSNLFAKEEKVTVYNNLEYPIIAVYKAVGYTGQYCGYYGQDWDEMDGNCVRLVKTTVLIPAHERRYATFGAGTSGRHVIISLPGESVTYGLLDSWNDYSNLQGYTANETWLNYLCGKELLLADSYWEVDETSAGRIIHTEIRSHGCDHKFNVVGHSSGTLEVNDIYFTGEVSEEGSNWTYFDAHCDCDKTEN